MLYLSAVKHQTRLSVLCACALLLATPARLVSHEIPARVAVRAWVAARDTVLTLLVRVPLEAMRDLDFPERANGTLDMTAVRGLLPDAARLWVAEAIVVYADGADVGQGRVRAVRVALPDDRSFATWPSAYAIFERPLLGDSVSLPWRQASLDVALEYPIPSASARLEIAPRLARLGVRTLSVFNIVAVDGSVRSLSYEGDPGLVSLDPRWWQSAAQFLQVGFAHILGGVDHLLFVFCLVLPVRRWRPLVAVVTAFTVAHSITLAAAASGALPTALWFPPLVEVAIAVSILWLAVENVLLPTERLEGRWKVAFGFGLIHGFGFSFALQDQLQFAGSNLLSALAAFNVGVEAGQLLVLAVSLAVLQLLRRGLPAERVHLLTWVGSALVAHSAWHWMTTRWATLASYEMRVAMPTFDGAFALLSMRLGLIALIACAAALGLRQFVSRFLRT